MLVITLWVKNFILFYLLGEGWDGDPCTITKSIKMWSATTVKVLLVGNQTVTDIFIRISKLLHCSCLSWCGTLDSFNIHNFKHAKIALQSDQSGSEVFPKVTTLCLMKVLRPLPKLNRGYFNTVALVDQLKAEYNLMHKAVILLVRHVPVFTDKILPWPQKQNTKVPVPCTGKNLQCYPLLL